MTYVPQATEVGGQRWLSFRNDAEEAAPPFCLLRQTGYAKISGRAVMKCNKPNTTFETWYYVNGPREVAPGKFGSCASLFPTFAGFDDGFSPTHGQCLGAKPNEWLLFNNQVGFIVESITSDLPDVDGRVVVSQYRLNKVRGKADSAITKGNTGTVSIWAGVWGSEADTGFNVTAGNYYGDVESGAWLDLTNDGFLWYLTAADCDS